MDTNKEPMLIGIVTLLVGLGLGAGLGAWFVKSSQADNVPRAEQAFTKPAPQERAVSNTAEEWGPFRRMERMQDEIDRAIRDMTEELELSPGATVFRPDAGYSSSFDLHERNNHYELRAYLPDVKSSDVNVRVDNERTLHVSVTQRKQQKKDTASGSASFAELGQYEQVVTLPEAVKSSDMKIDRRDHEIVITIPKASSAKTPSI